MRLREVLKRHTRFLRIAGAGQKRGVKRDCWFRGETRGEGGGKKGGGRSERDSTNVFQGNRKKREKLTKKKYIRKEPTPS